MGSCAYLTFIPQMYSLGFYVFFHIHLVLVTFSLLIYHDRFTLSSTDLYLDRFHFFLQGWGVIGDKASKYILCRSCLGETRMSIPFGCVPKRKLTGS